MATKGKRWAGVAIGVVGLLVVGGLVVRKLTQSHETVTLHKGSVVEAVYGLGTVTAQRVFRLKFGVLSEIKKLSVKEGDTVKPGQVLLATQEGAVFKAPFEGTVTQLPFFEGETVAPQVVVLTLTDLRERYLLVSLEQQGALRIHKGAQVQLAFETLRGQRFSGTVSSVYPSQDQFMAQISVEQMPAEILPGMTADVAIQVAKKEGVLLVPVTAVANGKVHVLRSGSGRPQRVEVKLGLVDGSMAEVLSGDLKEGDEVVLTRR